MESEDAHTDTFIQIAIAVAKLMEKLGKAPDAETPGGVAAPREEIVRGSSITEPRRDRVRETG
jgi:hypothetical protein